MALVGSGVKASLEAVAWVTVTLVDVAVVSPEEVAWILRVPAMSSRVKGGLPCRGVLGECGAAGRAAERGGRDGHADRVVITGCRRCPLPRTVTRLVVPAVE